MAVLPRLPLLAINRLCAPQQLCWVFALVILCASRAAHGLAPVALQPPPIPPSWLIHFAFPADLITPALCTTNSGSSPLNLYSVRGGSARINPTSSFSFSSPERDPDHPHAPRFGRQVPAKVHCPLCTPGQLTKAPRSGRLTSTQLCLREPDGWTPFRQVPSQVRSAHPGGQTAEEGLQTQPITAPSSTAPPLLTYITSSSSTHLRALHLTAQGLELRPLPVSLLPVIRDDICC
jgi:hypothetical protein